MWSSWPWVSTTPTMSSRRSLIGSKSGRIRSTPGWCSSGNSTPQSTMSSLPLVLEDGHVAADLAEAAERGDAQGSRLEGGRVVDGAGHQYLLGMPGIRSRAHARQRSRRSARGSGDLRQGAAGGGVAVGAEVGEVGAGDVAARGRARPRSWRPPTPRGRPAAGARAGCRCGRGRAGCTSPTTVPGTCVMTARTSGSSCLCAAVAVGEVAAVHGVHDRAVRLRRRCSR